MEDILPLLQELELSETDAEVYLTLLAEGGLSLSELARKVGAERPTVYAAIDRLQQRSLIPKKSPYSRKITVESPQRLLALIEHRQSALDLQRQQLTQQLPRLIARYHERAQTNTLAVYEGKQQFLTVFEEVLQEAATEILFLGDAERFISLEGMAYERAWIKKRIKKNLHFKMLVFKNQLTERFLRDDDQELRTTRFLTLDGGQPFTNSFMVYGNKALFWNPDAARAIVIEDTGSANLMRFMFNSLWASASNDFTKNKTAVPDQITPT